LLVLSFSVVCVATHFWFAKHPGLRSQPKPARRPGRLLLVHDPPLVDLPALALARLNVIARQLTLAGDSLCWLTPRLHGSFPNH